MHLRITNLQKTAFWESPKDCLLRITNLQKTAFWESQIVKRLPFENHRSSKDCLLRITDLQKTAFWESQIFKRLPFENHRSSKDCLLRIKNLQKTAFWESQIFKRLPFENHRSSKDCLYNHCNYLENFIIFIIIFFGIFQQRAAELHPRITGSQSTTSHRCSVVICVTSSCMVWWGKEFSAEVRFPTPSPPPSVWQVPVWFDETRSSVQR